jgi:hypothetical protein
LGKEVKEKDGGKWGTGRVLQEKEEGMGQIPRMFVSAGPNRKLALFGLGVTTVVASFGFAGSPTADRFTGDVAVVVERFPDANQTVVMVLVDLPGESGETDGIADRAFHLQTLDLVPQIPNRILSNTTVRHSEKRLELQHEGNEHPFLLLTTEEGAASPGTKTIQGFGLGWFGGFSGDSWQMTGFRISDAVPPCFADGSCSCDEEDEDECDPGATGCSIGGCPASGENPTECGRNCQEGFIPCCCCSRVLMFMKACCYCLAPEE